MGRIAKSVDVTEKKLSKDEKRKRELVESTLKGENPHLKPSPHLNKEQKRLFNFIVSNLENTGILGMLDAFMIETVAIAIERLKFIENMINNDINLLQDRNLMASKDKYTKDLFKCCGELCMSPQARARMGVLALQKEKEAADPLLRLLSGE